MQIGLSQYYRKREEKEPPPPPRPWPCVQEGIKWNSLSHADLWQRAMQTAFRVVILEVYCAKLIQKRLDDWSIWFLSRWGLTYRLTLRLAFFVGRRQIIRVRELSNKVFLIKLRHLPSVQSCKVLSCVRMCSVLQTNIHWYPQASWVRRNINNCQSVWLRWCRAI